MKKKQVKSFLKQHNQQMDDMMRENVVFHKRISSEIEKMKKDREEQSQRINERFYIIRNK